MASDTIRPWAQTVGPESKKDSFGWCTRILAILAVMAGPDPMQRPGAAFGPDNTKIEPVEWSGELLILLKGFNIPSGNLT